MTKWSELQKMAAVPEDIKEYEANLCEKYNKEHPQYTYSNEPYIPQTHLQYELNANIDEREILRLINTDNQFVTSVNDLLLIAEDRIDIAGKHLTGRYAANTAHGLTDHDLPQIAEYNTPGSWVDILRDDVFDKCAIYSIEVKSTSSRASNKNMNPHKADLVFKHYIDNGQIEVFAPAVPYASRKSLADYVSVGIITGYIFDNKRIDRDWNISTF